MLRTLKILLTLIGGIALGLAATWATVIRTNNSDGIGDGSWRTSLFAGSSEGGPYLRAYVAVHGLLALNRTETIYYNAHDDSDSHALDGHCSYRVEGA
jgi:hypothetical protein